MSFRCVKLFQVSQADSEKASGLLELRRAQRVSLRGLRVWQLSPLPSDIKLGNNLAGVLTLTTCEIFQQPRARGSLHPDRFSG